VVEPRRKVLLCALNSSISRETDVPCCKYRAGTIIWASIVSHAVARIGARYREKRVDDLTMG